jgi:hypothetical protein
MAATRQNARAIRAADYHIDIRFCRCRQQTLCDLSKRRCAEPDGCSALNHRGLSQSTAAKPFNRNNQVNSNTDHKATGNFHSQPGLLNQVEIVDPNPNHKAGSEEIL